MGIRAFIARLRSASTVRTRASEPFDAPALPAPVPLEQLHLRAGVMAHVFYPDLIDEFAATLGRMPLHFTLLVSVMDAASETRAREVFRRLANVQTLVVRQVDNRGRDIAPLLVTFREEVMALDLLCHIHTKKSLYTGSEQQPWRQYLLDSLLGSPERIAWILGIFQADPRLGLVYPESFPGVPLWAHTWLSNATACEALAQRLGIALDAQRYIDFPAGSMFWARVDALRPLYDLDLPLTAFPPEHGQVDGTLQHAVERLFGIITRHQGFRLGILPSDGSLALAAEGERNVYDALQTGLSDRLTLAALDARMVTVDIFDTLVTRAFLTPAAARDHLAWRLQRQWGISDFARHRADAESCLREILQRDPTLSEIHDELAARLSLPDVDADMLAGAERAHERAVLSPRQGVLAALAHAQLMPLTAFSDMYLSGDDMHQVLPGEVQQHVSRWWISCETGLRKDAEGSWKQLAQREGREDGRWLHVGDNEHADIQVPQLAGLLTPVHVLRPSALLDVVPALRPLRHPSGTQAPWPEQLWRGLLANGFATLADTSPHRLLGRPQLDARMLGHAVLGPLVLDFLLHAVSAAHRHDVDHLLFLSREGYLLEQAFTRLQGAYPAATSLKGSYFLASRRATLLPALFTTADLPLIVQGTFNGPLRGLLQARLGDEAATQIATLQTGLMERDVFLPEMAGDVLHWLEPAADALLALAGQQRQSYRAYWARMMDNSTPMVVDVGYAGSIQRNLARMLGSPLGGYYMALRAGASALADHGWAEARYFDGRSGSSEDDSVILANDLLLESLLAAPQGQFNGFAGSADAPRFGPMELTAKAVSTLADVHAGALAFIDEACTAIGQDIAGLNLDAEGVQVPLHCLGSGRWDADNVLAQLTTEDAFTGRGTVSAAD
ncbi:polysaccharide biosynthesis protein [Stenotrophomonas indicatrix]|uniref:rhamnan synthesis F family protein n=1 Tax=Stenotrophomonas indicatrix TaxID=2045451 RepID=UPI0030087836